MELTITTLIENMPAADERLKNEHGLSLYIEFDGKRILFDTGQTGDYLLNAQILNKPIENIDYLIVSHGHYDHSGGVEKTLPYLNNTEMYVGEGFFKPKYKRLETGDYKYNGVGFDEKLIKDSGINLIKVTEHVTYISDKILLFKNFERSNDFEKLNPKFVIKEEAGMVLDKFSDEVVLGLVTSKGLIIVLGCSHVGVVNIITSIHKCIDMPIYAVIGGTHMVEADEGRIDKTIDIFRKMGIKQIAVSHCTGENGICRLKDVCGDTFILNNTGNVFEV